MTVDRWRQELSLWLDVLVDRLQIEVPALPTREEMADLWIIFEAIDEEDFEPKQWTLLLEALELLDFLVRVDADVGWSLVFSIAGVGQTFMVNQATLFPRDKVIPRYSFEWIDSMTIAPNFQTVFQGLRRMIGEDDQPWEPPSSEFPRVKQLLLNEWKLKYGRDFDRCREGRIIVKPQVSLLSDFHVQPVPFMMQHTLALARASRTLLPREQQVKYPGWEKEEANGAAAQQLAIRRRRAVFCFEAVDFELLGQPVTNELLDSLLYVTKCALPITKLVIDQIVMDDLHYSVAGAFFMDVFSVWFGSHLKQFEFASVQFDVKTISPMCSALALSRSLYKFSFTCSGMTIDEDGNRLTDPIDRSKWWPWLAYALFSADVQHEIHHVKLDIRDLRLSDVEAMRVVCQHPNPLSYLCSLDTPLSESCVLSTKPMAAVLKPASRITIGHRVAKDEDGVDRGSAKVTTAYPHQIVRDNADEDFLEIMFPGSGVAWIDRECVQEIQHILRRPTHPVVHLELEGIRPESQPAALELLGFVGESLQRLSIFGYGTLDDTFMTTVCGLCPRLKSLHIDGTLESMHWLISPSSIKGPRCVLERLVLSCYFTDQASLLEFIQILGKGDHEVTKSLRDLQFRQPGYLQERVIPIEKLGGTWLQMLRTNWRLERCEYVSYNETEETQVFRDRIRAYNGQAIFVPHKVAFLSVLMHPSRFTTSHKRYKRSNTKWDETSARYNLPQETIELILVMADIPLRRICA